MMASSESVLKQNLQTQELNEFHPKIEIIGDQGSGLSVLPSSTTSKNGSDSVDRTELYPIPSGLSPTQTTEETTKHTKMASSDEETPELCNMIPEEEKEEEAEESVEPIAEFTQTSLSSPTPSTFQKELQSKATTKRITLHDSIKSNFSTKMIEYYREEYNGTSKRGKRGKRTQSEDEVDSWTPEGTKENRPSKARWKQQKTPAWQPVYKPVWIVGSFLVVGLLVTGTGVAMLIANLKTSEFVHDYTQCDSMEYPNQTCASVLLDHPDVICTCWIQFSLSHEFATPLYLYYGMHRFYQNHRRYRQSVNWDQLKGSEISSDQAEANCAPYSLNEGHIIAPCGIVANSLFTDTFRLYALDGGTKHKITLRENDISWPSDRNYRFKNPPGSDPWGSMAKPVNWSANQWAHWRQDGGYTNEHFIVWMRTATFTTFRKLWARVDWGSVSPNAKAMPAGEYAVEIDYRYRTVFPKLTVLKEVILGNTSWLGGPNLFLPILYLVTGIMAILTSAFLLWLSLKYHNKEMEPLTRKTPYIPGIDISRLS